MPISQKKIALASLFFAVVFLGVFILDDVRASQTFTITVEKTGDGSGVVQSPGAQGFNCGAGCTRASLTRSAGSSVVINAQPDTGATFKGWSGDGCSGSHSTCTVVLNRNLNVRAEFVRATSGRQENLSGEIITNELKRNQHNIVEARVIWTGCTAGTTQNVSLFIEAQGRRPHSLQNLRQSLACPTDGWRFHWNLHAPSDFPDNSWGNSATLSVNVGDREIVKRTVPIVPAVGTTNGGTPPPRETPPGTPPPSGQNLVLQKGWNIVSNPMTGDGPSLADISQRCGRNSAFIRWNPVTNKNDTSTTMIPGHAYWVRATQNCSVPVPGNAPWTGGSIRLAGAGWHMIGAPSGGISPDDIGGDCRVSSIQWWNPALGSNGQYVVHRDRLQAGRGYFIRVNGACELNFSPERTVEEQPPQAPAN